MLSEKKLNLVKNIHVFCGFSATTEYNNNNNNNLYSYSRYTYRKYLEY